MLVDILTMYVFNVPPSCWLVVLVGYTPLNNLMKNVIDSLSFDIEAINAKSQVNDNHKVNNCTSPPSSLY